MAVIVGVNVAVEVLDGELVAVGGLGVGVALGPPGGVGVLVGVEVGDATCVGVIVSVEVGVPVCVEVIDGVGLGTTAGGV